MVVARKPIPLDQKRELLRMLSDFNGYANRPEYKRERMPFALKCAERRVASWNAEQRRKEKVFKGRWERKLERIRKEIYFGTAQRAITLMERLRP